MYEHLAESQEENVGKCKRDTYTDIPSDTSASLLGRKGYTHDSEDECRERKGKAGVLLDKRELDIGVSTHLLNLDEFVQLVVRQGLHCIFREIEVLN